MIYTIRLGDLLRPYDYRVDDVMPQVGLETQLWRLDINCNRFYIPIYIWSISEFSLFFTSLCHHFKQTEKQSGSKIYRQKLQLELKCTKLVKRLLVEERASLTSNYQKKLVKRSMIRAISMLQWSNEGMPCGLAGPVADTEFIFSGGQNHMLSAWIIKNVFYKYILQLARSKEKMKLCVYTFSSPNFIHVTKK